ncbi:hypothetical protein Zmor_024071 [Zophobas morio]|uniref:Uncharacterized protein n=1 Tax=Zophobas morio TaxID=2755281 RepID=A0AA38HZV0_9CUCU|nr:hypothetical protein Zmor_024071 [Zophobas morio]
MNHMQPLSIISLVAEFTCMQLNEQNFVDVIGLWQLKFATMQGGLETLDVGIYRSHLGANLCWSVLIFGLFDRVMLCVDVFIGRCQALGCTTAQTEVPCF